MGISESEAATMKEGAENAHPLLKGGNSNSSSSSHGFSSSQIQSLTAICQTLIPPHDNIPYDLPHQVAKLMVNRSMPQTVSIVRVVLKFLSTRLGTVMLCGWLSVDWKWPFLHTFSHLSRQRREAILLKWSGETFLLPLRIFFLVLKVITLYVFFSWLQKQTSHRCCWTLMSCANFPDCCLRAAAIVVKQT